MLPKFPFFRVILEKKIDKCSKKPIKNGNFGNILRCIMTLRVFRSKTYDNFALPKHSYEMPGKSLHKISKRTIYSSREEG
jgi:hypothetical protein